MHAQVTAIALTAILLTPEQTARMLGYTGKNPTRTMRKIRHEDRRRDALGLPRQGPDWVELASNCIRYRYEDVQRHIASRLNCGAIDRAMVQAVEAELAAVTG